MAKIKPFQGYIPKVEVANKVASPPYDVMTSDEARDFVVGNELSFLHVVKSEIDFPKGQEVSKEDIYQKGADNLQTLISEGNLVQSSAECFYLYQQQMGDHIQTGIVAGASVIEYNKNLIKKHENTRIDKEIDRAKHVETLNANAGPVFLTYKKSAQVDTLVSKLTKNTPDINFTANDGIRHTLWVIDNAEDVNAFVSAFAGVPELYVADGHHRSAAASRVQKIRMDANSNHTGEEQYNFFLTVIFPDDQMYIMDYNRVLKDTAGLSTEEIISKLEEKFEVAKLNVSDPEEAKPKSRGNWAMYAEGSWYSLKIKPQFVPQNDPVNSLDVAIMQNEVLDPIFGIKDPRTDNRLDFIGGIRGLKELVRRCETDCKLAIGFFPTGIDQLMAIADANEVMPPKSTWFEPKLRSGMVVRTLEESKVYQER